MQDVEHLVWCWGLVIQKSEPEIRARLETAAHGAGVSGRVCRARSCKMLSTWFGVGMEGLCFTEMCSGSEAGSYLRLIDLRITQL